MDDWTPEDDCPDSLSSKRRFIDIYADNVIVKYLIRPIALHALKYVHSVPITMILNANILSN